MRKLQCVLGAVKCTFHAKDAFRRVFPFPRIVRNLNVHRADPFTLSATDALVFVTLDTGQGKVTHRF